MMAVSCQKPARQQIGGGCDLMAVTRTPPNLSQRYHQRSNVFTDGVCEGFQWYAQPTVTMVSSTVTFVELPSDDRYLFPHSGYLWGVLSFWVHPYIIIICTIPGLGLPKVRLVIDCPSILPLAGVLPL